MPVPGFVGAGLGDGVPGFSDGPGDGGFGFCDGAGVVGTVPGVVGLGRFGLTLGGGKFGLPLGAGAEGVGCGLAVADGRPVVGLVSTVFGVDGLASPFWAAVTEGPELPVSGAGLSPGAGVATVVLGPPVLLAVVFGFRAGVVI